MLWQSRNGATAEERLRQGLGITNPGDFSEADEYLTQRLGLVTISGAGRALSPLGRRYLSVPSTYAIGFRVSVDHLPPAEQILRIAGDLLIAVCTP